VYADARRGHHRRPRAASFQVDVIMDARDEGALHPSDPEAAALMPSAMTDGRSLQLALDTEV
jgi:hypothetical protein